MTKLLEKALAEVAKLPEAEQDVFARQMLDELDEAQWDKSFADPRSEILLERLAAEAIAEDEAGETMPLEEFLGIEDKPGVPGKVRPASQARPKARKRSLQTLAK